MNLLAFILEAQFQGWTERRASNLVMSRRKEVKTNKNHGYVKTAIGVPQGQPESPGLFNLFTADLPTIFEGQGALLAGKKVPIILYADDMVLLSNSAKEMQNMLDKLCDYLTENKLFMNTSKTKVMTFHKGRLPNSEKGPFNAGNVELEKVSEFVYLGVTFTPQLAFSKHLEKLNARARAKIGHIFATTPIQNVSSNLAEELFKVYIQPIYEYCSAIWTSKVCKSALDNMDRVYLKFWKRYLQIPKSSSTDLTYLIAGTYPFSERIFQNPTKSLQTINLSIKLPGHQLNLVKNCPKPMEEYVFNKEVHPKFWEILHSQYRLPSDEDLRRRFTSKIFDLKHKYQCNRLKSDFHNLADPMKCKCKMCEQPMDWYHECQPILTNVAS